MSGMPYLPEPEDIHESWFAVWGDHIGSAKLGADIFSNTRTKRRAYEHLLASSDLDLDCSFSLDQITAFKAYANQREQLLRTCGLVMQGRVFRESISRASFDQLAKLLPADELRIAVSLRSLHPETDGLEIDLQRINELVERSGRQCIEAWIGGLSEQARLRVDLMSQAKPEGHAVDQDSGLEIAQEIVTEVSKAMISDRLLLAA